MSEEKTTNVVQRTASDWRSENFARIAELVRNMEGVYVSSGKDSHFRIPIK